jgi:hypothetical protein
MKGKVKYQGGRGCRDEAPKAQQQTKAVSLRAGWPTFSSSGDRDHITAIIPSRHCVADTEMAHLSQNQPLVRPGVLPYTCAQTSAAADA